MVAPHKGFHLLVEEAYHHLVLLRVFILIILVVCAVGLLVWANNMEAIATGAAGNVIASVFLVAVRLLNDLIRSAEKVEEMRSEIQSVKTLIDELHGRVNAQQERIIPKPVEEWLGRVNDALQTAQRILDDYHRHQRRPRWLCWLISVESRLKLNRRIRHWKADIQRLLQQGNSISSAEHVLSTAPRHPHPLRQPVPKSGYVGSAIKSAQSTLEDWLIRDDRTRVVGVHGAGGAGKTSLLKMIHNSDEVNKAFEVVIWTTVSKEFSIADIQSCLANRIGLQLPETSDMDLRKMMLHESLNKRRFLLILDDMWSHLELEEVGVPSHKTSSKFVLSSRDEGVCRSMGADQQLKMGFLSDEEGWELFRRHSFGDDPSVVIRREIEVIAREIARDCKGLPLALKAVGAALANQPDVSEWELALRQMKRVDTTFYEIHADIARDLFQPLKWSYDALPESLRICFLYLAAYPEGTEIPADELITLWIAEGALEDSDENMGHSFLKSLRDRCLLDISETQWGAEMVKMHDVLRDLAIYIGEKEKNCYFRAGQNMYRFPVEEDTKMGRRRISLMKNDIRFLPTNFECPTLTTLLLAENLKLQTVPESFLCSLQSLRILDLSFTRIQSLPKSLGQLKHLVSLQLRRIQIEELPETTCSLDNLRFLNLGGCRWLRSLPPKIGELLHLRSLDLSECASLDCLPSGILQLTGLKRLYIDLWSPVTEGVMGKWTKMTELSVDFGDTDQRALPEDMQAMVALQRLTLQNCHVTRLPGCICEYQYLSELNLFRNEGLKEMPQLHRLPRLRKLRIKMCIILEELGESFGRANGFPMLEQMVLEMATSLESLAGRGSHGSGVLEEGAMPALKKLTILGCYQLRRLPVGTDRLKSLEQIRGQERWWNAIIWEDESTRESLQTKFCRV